MSTKSQLFEIGFPKPDVKVFIKQRQAKKQTARTLKTIPRSNKLIAALQLPVILNLNPRSLYNKLQNFKEYVSENNVDVVCVSESWEREEETIESILNDDELSVISNPFQRKGRGGRPIIIVNNTKFNVERLDIPCPWGVEMVWAILSIKKSTSLSKIQKIVIGSFYSKPASRKKQVLLDHISDVFHLMSSKFRNGLYFHDCK